MEYWSSGVLVKRKRKDRFVSSGPIHQYSIAPVLQEIIISVDQISTTSINYWGKQEELGLSSKLFHPQNGIFRTELGTDGAAGAKVFIDHNLPRFQKHGRTTQFVDTDMMALAFLEIHMKWPGWPLLADRLCKQRAEFPGNDDRKPVICERGLDRLYGLFNLKRLYHMDVLDPASPHNVFNEDLCAFNAQRLGVNSRMGLMSGHGRGAVVHDHQGECMVVVHRIDESCYSGMEKGGITDESDHLLVSSLGKAA